MMGYSPEVGSDTTSQLDISRKSAFAELLGPPPTGRQAGLEGCDRDGSPSTLGRCVWKQANRTCEATNRFLVQRALANSGPGS
jgi:hypothetical protein